MSTRSDASLPLRVDDVEVAGQRWRVAWREPPAGEPRMLPLVLCNGIGVNWELFAPLVQALAPRPVVAFDVPGVGASPVPRMPYRLAGIARELLLVLPRIGVDGFDLLGVSWGGALAQQLALQAQVRCRRLVLAGTTPGWGGVPGDPRALLQLRDPRRHTDGVHAMRVLPSIYGGALRRRPDLLARFLADLEPAPPRGYALQLLALAGWSSVWWLPLLRQRTLLLAGDDDPLVPIANAHLMQRLLRHGELHVVPDGHLFLHTDAEGAAARITRFLDAP